MVGLRKFIRQWVFVSFGLLAFFTITRAWALIYYGKNLGDEPLGWDVAKAFFMGFRFDLSAVAYLNTVPVLAFILWLLVPGPRMATFTAAVFRLWIGLWVPLYVFITVVDFLFYDYFQDHLNTMVFGFIEDDTTALIKTMWKGYNTPIYLLIFLGVTMLWGRQLVRLFRAEDLNPSSWRWFARGTASLTLFVAVFLAARGTLALFPLNVADASVSRSPFVNYLAFSGVHAFARAVELQSTIERKWDLNADFYGYHHFADISRDLFKTPPGSTPADPMALLKKKTPPLRKNLNKKPHVVVIMMESFGLTWLRYHREDFNVYAGLEKHFYSDYLFPNFFPSMTATIGSLSAFMVNLPHRTFGEFLTEGRYFNVPFRSAPARFYQNQGYKTRFLYGGAIGWRNVDRFARLQGFDAIEGDFEITAFERDILNQTQEVHDWGYYDDVVFKYLEHSLAQATEPQFVLVMTTTNHPPFDVPSTYRGPSLILPNDLLKILIVDPDTAQKRFRAFQYSNLVLAEFLDRLKGGPLADQTLVAVTGDHGFLLKNFSEAELLQKWQVPFYLYLPESIKRHWSVDRKQLQVFGSHPDIMPTLYELSIGEADHYSFGANLLTADSAHAAFHYSQLALSQKGGIIALGKEKMTALKWSKEYEELSPSEPTQAHLDLHRKYRATMGFLDFLFEHERKKLGDENANSGR